MPIDYLVEIFKLNGGGNLSEIEKYCLVSDFPFSVGLGRCDISCEENSIFLDCPKRILIKDCSVSSSHGVINFSSDGSFSYHDNGSTNGSYLARKDGESLVIDQERISKVFGRDLYIVLSQSILLHIYSHTRDYANTQRINKPEGLLPINSNPIPSKKRSIVIKLPK
ncbi:MAG: FHA domain-containing protein [Candidatus Pacearchaeota archaeon]